MGVRHGRRLAKHQRTHPYLKVRGQILLPKLMLIFYQLSALALVINQRGKIKLGWGGNYIHFR